MKTSISLLACASLVALALPLNAQVSTTARTGTLQHDLERYFNSGTRVSTGDWDRRDRECRDVWRERSQRRMQFEQRVRQQHENWHRTHNSRRDANWHRQHEALHQRLQRERAVFERNEQRIRERYVELARRQRSQSTVSRSRNDDRFDCYERDDDDRYSRNRERGDWHDRDDWNDDRRDLKHDQKIDKKLDQLDRKREKILEKERRRS
jgi:hypothetical protein